MILKPVSYICVKILKCTLMSICLNEAYTLLSITGFLPLMKLGILNMVRNPI
jgi:hypothetical protein